LNIVPLMALGLLIMVGLFAIYWLIQFKIGDSGVVDVFWGASVAVVGVLFCVLTSGDSTRRLVAGILISLWAARLSFHLWVRWKSHEEDARYTALKQKWGQKAQLRMLRFYQMQGLGAFLFALPLLVIGGGWTGRQFWSGWFRFLAKRYRTNSYTSFDNSLKTKVRSVVWGFGTTLAIPITFSNGCTGGVMRCSRSLRRWDG